MTIFKLIILGLLLVDLSLFKLAACNYELSVRAGRYRNSGHKLSSGDCCEVDSTSNCNPWWCIGCPSCDNYFRFCLRDAGSAHDGDLGNCPLGYYSSGSGSVGGDNFAFGSSIGNVPNPFTFSGTIWPGSVQLYIRIMDDDLLNSDDHVDDVYIEVVLMSPSTTNFQYYTGDFQNSEIELMFRVGCLNNYYGEDCGRYCVDTDNDDGHYTCDSDGFKICNEGWSNPGLSCTVADCTSCNPIGASCNLPEVCNCYEGWEGDFCNDCVPAQGCSPTGGYCNVPSECICHDGFIGLHCEVDTLVCEMNNPCVNGGACNNDGVGGYLCHCLSSFSGHNCEIEINACTSSPCINGGTCTVSGSMARCSCEPDWTGPHCDIPVHPCLVDPLQCEHGGICQVALATDDVTTVCVCLPGYTGRLCEVEINHCQPDPCQNQATCRNGIFGFECECQAGFEGENCQTNHNDCLPSPCENGGSCMDMVDGYHCSCAAGFTGERCERDIDDCETSLCENDGTCFDEINNYTCLCPFGFSGRNCETRVNGCSNNPCLNEAACTSHDVILFQCECVSGYYGDRCESEINECLTNPCGSRGNCIDLVADYRCDCLPDYTGPNCEVDMNMCRSSPCVNGVCVNYNDDYRCNCSQGYTGQHCEEIDDCASSPCSYPGVAMCVDAPNDYICVCEPGYTGRDCEATLNNPTTTTSDFTTPIDLSTTPSDSSPTASDSGPTTSDSSPTTNDSGPTTSDSGPTTSDSRPTTSGDIDLTASDRTTGSDGGTASDRTTGSGPSLAAQGANVGGVVGGSIAGLLVVFVIVVLILGVVFLFLKNRKSKSYATRTFSVSSCASDEAFVNPTYTEASGLNIQTRSSSTGNSYQRDFSNPIYGSDVTDTGPSVDPVYSDIQDRGETVYESIPSLVPAQEYNRLQRDPPAEEYSRLQRDPPAEEYSRLQRDPPATASGEYAYIATVKQAAINPNDIDNNYSTLDQN